MAEGWLSELVTGYLYLEPKEEKKRRREEEKKRRR